MQEKSNLPNITNNGKKVSRLQQQFNSRIKRINKAKEDIKKIEEKTDLIQSKIAEHIHPEISKLIDAKKEFVYFLDKCMGDKSFKKDIKNEIEVAIANMTSELIIEHQQKDLIPIFDKYSPQSYEKVQQDEGQRIKDQISQYFAESTDFDIDLDDIEIDITDPLAFMRNFQQKIEEKQQNDETFDNTKKINQAEKDEKFKNVTQTAKKIYKSLITEFHPDKEMDEAKKSEKTEIIKKVTQAYEEDDLFELLRLKLELQQTENTDLENLPEDELKYYNTILLEQLKELEMKLYSLKNGFDPKISQLLRCRTNKTLEKNILGGKKEIQDQIDDVQSDLEYLKASKKNVKSYFEPRDQEDLLAMFSDMFK